MYSCCCILITHIIIEETNRKECAPSRAKTLTAKVNMVEDKPAPKMYEKKFDKKNINSFIPMELTPPLRKRKIALSVEIQVMLHLSADIGPKTIILLRQI